MPTATGCAELLRRGGGLHNASGKLEPSAHALASGTQVYAGPAGKEVTDRAMVAWTNISNGKSRVFATTLGHNNATVDSPPEPRSGGRS